MKKILIINGPNLNLLGNREKKFYGDTTLEKIKILCDEHCKKNEIECSFFQSNHEGELIEKIHSVESDFDGIIVNPAAFTHTSIARTYPFSPKPHITPFTASEVILFLL